MPPRSRTVRSAASCGRRASPMASRATC
jgi:hypothetical protein